MGAQDKRLDALQLFTTVLTKQQRKDAFAVFTNKEFSARNIGLTEILKPAMPEIDRITGQPNNVRYFAYLLEHVFNQVGGLF